MNAQTIFSLACKRTENSHVAAYAIKEGTRYKECGKEEEMIRCAITALQADANKGNNYHSSLLAVCHSMVAAFSNARRLIELNREAARISAQIRLTEDCLRQHPSELARLTEIAQGEIEVSELTDGELWEKARTFDSARADRRVQQGMAAQAHPMEWAEAMAKLTTQQMAAAWRDLAWQQRSYGTDRTYAISNACEMRAERYKKLADIEVRGMLKSLTPAQVDRSYNGAARSAPNNKGFSDDAATNARRLKACQKAADSSLAKIELSGRAVTVCEGNRCTTLWINTDR